MKYVHHKILLVIVISESERNEYFAAKNQYPKQVQIEATGGDSESWELRSRIFTCCVAHSEQVIPLSLILPTC